jgi:hypothetical protein
MTVNATIIVQIFHFFIAYFLISQFFLKPIVQILFAEESEQNTLLAAINQYKKLISILEQKKNELWRSFREQFYQQIPHQLRLPVPMLAFPPVKPKTISIEKQKELIDSISKEIITRVSHVDT